MRKYSRSLVPIAGLLVLAAVFALVSDPAARSQATSAAIPTLEVTPLLELAGGSRVTGGGGNWQVGIVLSGQTREMAGPWKACVWSLQVDTLFIQPALDVTRSSGANVAGLAASDSDTVIVAAGFSYNTMNRMKPIVWRKSVSDTQWTGTVLPTLEGLEGAVLSILGEEEDDILGEEGDDFVGWSSATGPVEKAVLWTRDGGGGWAVRMLSHYAPSLPGRALDGCVPQTGDTLICGWAQDSEGDTNAVVWKKSTGVWTRAELPLLAGGTQGMVNSILGEDVDDLVGWSEDAVGQHRAVLWHFDGASWQVEELTPLISYAQSVPILGDS